MKKLAALLLAVFCISSIAIAAPSAEAKGLKVKHVKVIKVKRMGKHAPKAPLTMPTSK